MKSRTTTRRKVVIGGAATVAVGVPVAMAQFESYGVGAPTKEEMISPAPAAPGAPGERERWEAMVGQSFQVMTERGYAGATLAAVERLDFDPERPETLARQNSFYAFFTIGTSMAPAGQESYVTIQPGGVATPLFLSRGVDVGNETRFSALFN